MINKARVTVALMLTAGFVVTSCSGSASSGSSSPASSPAATSPTPPPTAPSSSAASQSTAPAPTTFTSETYGYTATVPAGWSTTQAAAKWDGESELDGTSPLADLLGQPSETRGIFVAAARWKRNLAAYATFLIAWQAHYHEQCPRNPNTRSTVTVGGERGVLLAYNCGILVNDVATVHHGVGYLFVFVDQGVAAATDRADRATFLKVLRSVRLPD